ncbi:MAG: FAD-dependent monooxygenase [Rhodococcus sp. (in: high G+C Gram-positive bacteria)]|uniref:FAD-dependent monooxygenase n=1 Tax=Rhodococcus sp. TaxID=1831 RepID=UPI002AD826E0|nr:FAD-dependent monooxygenase [Rhodococcus sp. (in: high G+C Gram-positive bacteria)]
MSAHLTIGICGAGIGGLSALIALNRVGLDAEIFEQTSAFARVGADINLTPNAVRALDGLGVGDELRKTAARPQFRISRMWNTGEETSRLAMSEAAEEKFGAPQLTMHRADLMSALVSRVPEGSLQMGKRVENIEFSAGAKSSLAFTDGTSTSVDLLIGADGIHSAVRKAMFGADHPTFTGVVAFRAVIPTEKLAGSADLDCFTKWWGPDPETQIVMFPLNKGRDMFVFATCPQDEWLEESWTTPGSSAELRDLYRDFHPEAQAILAACDEVLKSALYVRDPLESWINGVAALLGDACHPMMPFMAQGAGQAIEDAVVLARCLDGVSDIPSGLRAYQEARLERTAQIQRGSRSNQWLKAGGNADWVYGYDAWDVPIGLSV